MLDAYEATLKARGFKSDPARAALRPSACRACIPSWWPSRPPAAAMRSRKLLEA